MQGALAFGGVATLLHLADDAVGGFGRVVRRQLVALDLLEPGDSPPATVPSLAERVQAAWPEWLPAPIRVLSEEEYRRRNRERRELALGEEASGRGGQRKRPP